jgi:hypothetical protein
MRLKQVAYDDLLIDELTLLTDIFNRRLSGSEVGAVFTVDKELFSILKEGIT